MTKIVTKLALWVITFTIVTTIAAHLMTLPNTACNIIGFVLMVATITCSVQTKCFTSITIFNKQKKDDEE